MSAGSGWLVNMVNLTYLWPFDVEHWRHGAAISVCSDFYNSLVVFDARNLEASQLSGIAVEHFWGH